MNYTLITGSTSDIGKNIAQSLSSKQNLILSGRNPNKLEETLNSLANPKSHKILTLDLKNISGIKDSISCLLNGGGGIESFIHCGAEAEFSPIRYFDYMQSLDIFNINFFSCCEIISTLLKKPNRPYLKNIILISSISALKGYKGSSIYGASKACLDSLTRSLCDELSPQIKINSIILGNIPTIATKKLEMLKPSPSGEGRCEDVSALVKFLLESGYLNGQNIVLDGGRSTIGG